MPYSRKLAKTGRRQSGVYAIEFAFVFLIVFFLLYAAICYGFLLTARMGLQNAAEEGARAGLRYQISLDAKKTEAGNVATQRASWLPTALKSNLSVQATVCMAGEDDCLKTPVCGQAWTQRCQMVVTVTVKDIQKLLPPFPSFALPDQITGKASMLLDGRPL
ncbi:MULTISPECIES: TadE/TadG family type IV pilus assembly protein [Variovorax]|uniref:TadE/TadG family type IV pilus assembly protein n=1 Tax=Variovorax TaxID=34072 RepID=UPI00119B5488|nr:TadE/TadG family type IV pilus assembly protein [Variovorax paradoxus]MDR6523557.1 Flp pilus assembly protein TadG [Variovorax paradoxus]